MKKNILLVILFLTSCALRNKNYAPTPQIKNDKFGIGLLHITIKEQDILLFDTNKSETPFDIIKVRKIFPKSDGGPFEFNTTLKGNLAPYRIYGGRIPTKYDYLKEIAYIPIELTFRVIKKVENNYYVVINEKDNRLAIIRDLNIKDPAACSFETWKSYLISAESIEIQSTYQDPIYKRPNGRIAQISPNIKFKVNEIDGYWLKITDITKKSKRAAYWIKWRDSDKALDGIVLNFKYYRTLI